MKKYGCRALTVLIAVMILFSTVFVCAADSIAQIGMSALKYDNESGTYQLCNSFYAGETVVIGISFSGIENVAVRGNTIAVTYDSSIAEIQTENSVCSIADENACFLINANDNKAILAWDTTSKDTHFNDMVYYLKFKVSQEIKESKTLDFGLEVQDLYESANGFNDIPFNIVNTNIGVAIVSEEIDQSIIELFNKLEKVDVNSLSDITDAMSEYEALSDRLKKHLSVKYPQQFEWLSTAYDRYYAAVQQASKEEIEKIVSDFLSEYKDLLNKDISKITLKDATKIEKMKKEYDAMPTLASSRLSKEVKEKIVSLDEKITAIKDAKKEVEDFRGAYSQYYELEDAVYLQYYNSYYLYIDEALMVYDSLSEEAKAQLQTEYERLKQIDALIDKCLEDEATSLALREKANEFQRRWLRVFALTSTSVSIADKSAIEMTIADYETLEDGVKELLKGRIANLNNLLTVIKSLEDENSDKNEGDSSGDKEPEKIIETVTETVTQTVIEKVPEKVIEKVPETVTQVVPEIKTEVVTETVTQVVPEIKTEVVTETVTEVVTETVAKEVRVTKFTKAIWVLLGMLALAAMTLIFPVMLQFKYNRLISAESSDDYDDRNLQEGLE